jgi:hypothetical protein
MSIWERLLEAFSLFGLIAAFVFGAWVLIGAKP